MKREVVSRFWPSLHMARRPGRHPGCEAPGLPGAKRLAIALVLCEPSSTGSVQVAIRKPWCSFGHIPRRVAPGHVRYADGTPARIVYDSPGRVGRTREPLDRRLTPHRLPTRERSAQDVWGPDDEQCRGQCGWCVSSKDAARSSSILRAKRGFVPGRREGSTTSGSGWKSSSLARMALTPG